MKKVRNLITAVLGLLIVLLGTTNSWKVSIGAEGVPNNLSNQANEMSAEASIIGAEGVPQPEWVRNIPKETEDTVWFVGVGEGEIPESVKRRMATLDAQRQLVIWAGDSETEQITSKDPQNNTVSTTTITKGQSSVAGLREEESWIAADGNYVALFSYQKDKNDRNKSKSKSKGNKPFLSCN